MSSISRVSLEDTLYLFQMVRESALAKGQTQQANRLAPIVEGMRSVVSVARQAPAARPAPAAGILGQQDFKAMMGTAREAKPAAPAAGPSSTNSVADRNHMVGAMASSGMAEIDIARQLGMTRDEVRLVLSFQNRGKFVREVWK